MSKKIMKKIENLAILDRSVWAVLLGVLVSGFALAGEDGKNEFSIDNITPAEAQYSATLSGAKTTLVMDVSTVRPLLSAAAEDKDAVVLFFVRISLGRGRDSFDEGDSASRDRPGRLRG